MKLQQAPDWHSPQRQAGAGLFVILYKAIFTFVKAVWPILVILLFRDADKRSLSLQLLVTVIAILVLAGSLIQFYFFRFFIDKDDLVIRKGLINKKTLTIPLKNIQAVNIEQSWLHQLLNISRVKIDTAGTDKAEATIDAIANNKAALLRSFLLEQKKEQEEAVPAPSSVPQEILTLSFPDVLKLGITANHIQTFFIILAFSLSLYQNLIDIFGNIISRFVEESSSMIMLSTRFLLALTVVVLLISVVASLIRMALVYFDFKLGKAEKGFRISSGLTNLRQNLVPFSKIQYISWKANWVRRQVKLFILEYHQANTEEQKRTQKAQVPLMNTGALQQLLAPYHLPLQKEDRTTHHMHGDYAIRRLIVAGIPAASLFTVVGWYFIQEYALLFLLWAPFVYVSAMVYRKNFQLHLSPDALQTVSGVWGREYKILQWYKIQKTAIRQSPWQRRNGVADLLLYTAGGNIRIRFIDLPLAQKLADYSLYKIESGNRNWL